MIQYVELFPHFKERLKYLNSLSPNGIYLVSDMKSKISFQETLLEKKEVLEETHIQRAQDFYSSLFLFNFPNCKFISPPQLEFLFKNWNSEKTLPFPSILIYLQSFLPFLTHPEGEQIFEQWIQENDSSITPNLSSVDQNSHSPLTQKTQSRKRYIKPFLITQKFWVYLQKLNLMEKSCVKYALTNQDLHTWDFSLTVDLGFSIEPIEIEILQKIGNTKDVTILIPPPLKSPIFENSHKIFSHLKIKPSSHSQLKPQTQKKVYRFQNTVDEVQFITHEIRQILNSGVQASEIAVIAPHIESYWPCLKTYLKKEGIPFSKETSISYLSFPQIQKWLSSIRLFFKKVDYHTLEESYFYQKNFSLSHQQLKNSYENCDRTQDFKEISSILIHSENEITSEEFIKSIFKLWQASPLNFDMNSLLSELFYPFSKNLKTRAEFFVEMLESFLSQKTFLLTPPPFSKESNSKQELTQKTQSSFEKGVQLISLNALTSLQAQHIYLIGLNHQSCQKIYPHLMKEHEVQTILTDLGFYCPQLDPHQYEYEITHLLNHFQGFITMSYAQTQLNQEITQPARVWQLEYKNQKPPKKPQTVWSSIQQLDSLEKILKHSFHAPSFDEVKQSILSKPQKVKSFSFEKTSLSASKIKNYMTCPFIFLSQEIFKLQTKPSKDVNMNPLEKGSLFHHLFDDMIKNQLKTSSQIQQWIEEHSNEIQDHIMDEEASNLYKQELLSKALAFLENEKLNSEKIPQYTTLQTEFEFEAYWNFEKERLDSQGDVLIKGRIDRVDESDEQLLVIDYKSSFTNVFTLNSWEQNLDVQMPLYIQALENHFQKDVQGAVYLNLRDFTYKGFILKTSNWKPLLTPRSKFFEEEKVKSILKKINQNIQQKIKEMQIGNFQAKPHDPNKCHHCQWNQICRAKHL